MSKLKQTVLQHWTVNTDIRNILVIMKALCWFAIWQQVTVI